MFSRAGPFEAILRLPPPRSGSCRTQEGWAFGRGVEQDSCPNPPASTAYRQTGRYFQLTCNWNVLTSQCPYRLD